MSRRQPLLQSKSVSEHNFSLDITLNHERVDTRLMARNLDNQHENVMRLITDYRDDFEVFGFLRFQTGEIKDRGRPERFALLNEDQCYLLLTYCRNTAKVRALKVELVKAFARVRQAVAIRQTEYLPSYHALHDAIRDVANGSPNERWLHVNANKALNRLVGLSAGQRKTAGPLEQSLLAVGALLAADAVQRAQDRHEIHERISQAFAPLETALRLEDAK